MPIGRGDRLGNVHQLGTKAHIARFANPNSDLGLWLSMHAFDMQFLDEKFDGDAINLDNWTTNAGTGATAFAVPATPILSGAVRAATGTDGTQTNRVVNMYGPPIYSGDNNCGMQVSFRVSAITSIQFEIGFIDTYNTITTAVPAMPDVDAPTSWATGLGDAAILALDTEQTIATMRMMCIGSGSLNSGTGDTFTGVTLPTADTWHTVRVQLAGNTASVYFDGVLRATRASAIEGGTLVRPFFFVEGVSATSRNFDIRRIWAWQDYAVRTA